MAVFQVLEIITNPNAKGPSRDWLKIVKSDGARTKINAFFKKEMKEATTMERDILYLQSYSFFITGKDNLFRNVDYGSRSLFDLCFTLGFS